VIYDAFAAKRAARNNPWGAGATTLEWTLSSPPPFHSFLTPPHIPGYDEHGEDAVVVGHGSAA
jgi:cytochrome c oxidase subunit 1